jgi:hypothetical protein
LKIQTENSNAIKKIFFACYGSLNQLGQTSEYLKLKKIPCIFLEEEKKFVRAEQLVSKLKEDMNPYLFEGILLR